MVANQLAGRHWQLFGRCHFSRDCDETIRSINSVNNYSRVVRISFVSIFLYQVSFVRSDKGLDRVHRKTIGTSRDLARLFKRSQDFLGRPEEKVVSGEESIEIPRNNHAWRGKY